MKSDLNKIENTGYKIPVGYFDNFEDEFLAKRMSETIIKYAGETGYNAPEKYFDSVEDAVLGKLNASSETRVVQLFSRKHLMYAASIAALFVLAFTLIINNDAIPEDLNYEIVGDYILEEDIDSYELAALLSEDELSALVTEFYSDTYNSNSVEDYLIENVDLEEIIDQ